MEDKLLQKELLEEYVNALWKIAPDEYPWCENYQILSTAEQRVAAAVKVLEGVK
jgi:ribosome-associated toxin RatA of RatAB toxin-antitoxin module